MKTWASVMALLALPLLAASQPYAIQGLQCPDTLQEIQAGSTLNTLAGATTYKIVGDGTVSFSTTINVVDPVCFIGTSSSSQTLAATADAPVFSPIFNISGNGTLGLSQVAVQAGPKSLDSAVAASVPYTRNVHEPRPLKLAMTGCIMRGYTRLQGAGMAAQDTQFSGGVLPASDNCVYLEFAAANFTGATSFQRCSLAVETTFSTINFQGPVEFTQLTGWAIRSTTTGSSRITFYDQATFHDNTLTPATATYP